MTDDDVNHIVAQFGELYPPLITVKEAADIARLPSSQTIYDWSSRGLIDAIKIKSGRRVLFDRDGFVRFVLRGRPEAREF